MGNYVFSTDALVDVVCSDAEARESAHDMGGNIIPMLVASGGAQVYDFTRNEVPARPIATAATGVTSARLDAYYDAQMDLIAVHPIFNLYNMKWPILTMPEPWPPAKFVFADEGRTGRAVDSMVCSGVIVSGAEVRRSVLSPSVHIDSYSEVEARCCFPTSRSASEP